MYTEEDLELYSHYMDEVRNLIILEGSYLTRKARKNMLEGKTLNKIDNSTWCLKSNKQEFRFQSFSQWKLKEDRNKKIEQLLK